MSVWPIAFADVLAARQRLRPYLTPTPLRHYPELDRHVGHDIEIFVKHENHQPTSSFKARNGLSALSLLLDQGHDGGVAGATRGNHGLGLAWAGRELGVPVTICVPRGNNPEKNDGMRALGAELIEEGEDYDGAVAVAERIAAERGLRIVHSTNDRGVLAGAATLSLEILEERPELQALVVSVGGGSQAVGAMTVARGLRSRVAVYGVQAAAAPTIHDSWHAGEVVRRPAAPTIADGLATADVYELTFAALREGLAGFVAVDEAALAEAARTLLRTTHNLVEGAGAASLAGLLELREELAGKPVGIVLSGGNIDAETLRRILSHEL